MTEKSDQPRRDRVDSASGIAAAIVAGGKKITIPKHATLTSKERRIFAEITGEMSKSELTPHKVTMVVALAQQMASLELEQAQLRREGSVLTNSHGNAVMNPRAKVCSGLTSSILALRRSLGIHSRALEGGDNRNVTLRRAHNKANETMLDDLDPEGLIARPNVVPIRGQETDDGDE